MLPKRETQFHSLLAEPHFVDRAADDPGRMVDVIIPVKNTNPLWRANLLNIYQEIPMARLLLGDGGCEDDTLEIAREFPRVEVVDQRGFNSLGGCLRDLIERVNTEWFIYLHSDVHLPAGWFEAMWRRRADYDWFECERRMAVLVEFNAIAQNRAERAYSGSQMGRSASFEPLLVQIDDDFLYRNEDLILTELVEQHGGRCGRISDTYHIHEIMNKYGQQEPDFKRVQIERKEDPAYLRRTFDMQVRGLIKYTQPIKEHLIRGVRGSLMALVEMDAVDAAEFRRWTEATNPSWLPIVNKMLTRRGGWRKFSHRMLTGLRRLLSRLESRLLGGKQS
jgi:Glycosyl transferase family 2